MSSESDMCTELTTVFWISFGITVVTTFLWVSIMIYAVVSRYRYYGRNMKRARFFSLNPDVQLRDLPVEKGKEDVSPIKRIDQFVSMSGLIDTEQVEQAVLKTIRARVEDNTASPIEQGYLISVAVLELQKEEKKEKQTKEEYDQLLAAYKKRVEAAGGTVPNL